MDKIKQLLESPVPEDIAIGLKLLIKQTKVRKHKDLKELLEDIKFRNKEKLDVYVGRFNIFIYENPTYENKVIQIFTSKEPINTLNHRVIKL